MIDDVVFVSCWFHRWSPFCWLGQWEDGNHSVKVEEWVPLIARSEGQAKAASCRTLRLSMKGTKKSPQPLGQGR